MDPGSPLRYASIHGDPLKPDAPFAIRLKCSDGYKAAPHWHPVDENIVVLQGIFSVGTGDRFDTARMQDIPTGGYGFVPGRMNHFAVCKGETDILVYGVGPRLNNWIPASIGNGRIRDHPTPIAPRARDPVAPTSQCERAPWDRREES